MLAGKLIALGWDCDSWQRFANSGLDRRRDEGGDDERNESWTAESEAQRRCRVGGSPSRHHHQSRRRRDPPPGSRVSRLGGADVESTAERARPELSDHHRRVRQLSGGSAGAVATDEARDDRRDHRFRPERGRRRRHDDDGEEAGADVVPGGPLAHRPPLRVAGWALVSRERARSGLAARGEPTSARSRRCSWRRASPKGRRPRESRRPRRRSSRRRRRCSRTTAAPWRTARTGTRRNASRRR